jgi:hypothetical protein
MDLFSNKMILYLSKSSITGAGSHPSGTVRQQYLVQPGNLEAGAVLALPPGTVIAHPGQQRPRHLTAHETSAEQGATPKTSFQRKCSNHRLGDA